MAEIIQLREFIEARERAHRRAADGESLVEAIARIRESLAAVATTMRTAPEASQPELLERLEKLAAMLRYAMEMART